MKIKLVIDKVGYNSKPQGSDGGTITKRMTIDTVKEYLIEEIKESILQGKTIRPSYCGGREDSWKSQQLFMIDIDDNMTITEAIEKCYKLNIIPNFIYTSFSHTEEHHKFRLVFVIDKEISDYNIAKKIHLYLMEMMGESDEKCKNINRFYYAGKTIPFDSGNILDSDNLIEKSKDIVINDIRAKRKVKDNKDSLNLSSLLSSNGVLGVLDNNDISNIPILYSTPKLPSIEPEIYTIKAITNRDINILKSVYGKNEKKIFETNQEFIDYIRTEIDLGEFLGFHYPRSIRCIFHDDNNNSAGIFQNEDGAWIYHCFGCNVSYNIVGVIERLACFKSRPKTYKFIKEIFNLEIMETEWQKEQKEILLENLKILNNGEFEDNSPQANKNIKGIKHYLEKLILIALDNIHNENLTDEEGQVVFFASANYLAKQMGISPNSINKIYQKLVVLTYHKLLNKLDDKELPERFLKRAMAININSGKNNHINFFSIPSYTVNNFPDIEQRGKQWKDNHYTMKGVSREMFYRAEGLDMANELYPQYKQVTENIEGTYQVIDRTTTKKSDIRTNNIVKAIHELIEEHGYATERGIVLRLKDKYRYITTEIQIKKSLKEICDSYDLKRIRTNKETKEFFKMDSNGYPFIICKGEIVDEK